MMIRTAIMLLLAAMLYGCESWPHNEYSVGNTRHFQNAGELANQQLCETLAKLAGRFDLRNEASDQESVLCYFRNEINGFPLFLGARRIGNDVVVDTGAWNRDEEHESLTEAVEAALLVEYPDYHITQP